MKHLFIINPICTKNKGRADAVVRGIHDFMQSRPGLAYDVHISRWSRDALGFCRGYVLKAGDEPVRVHVLGGTSTHFEVVNAIVDLPHVQLALYPMGRTNIFLHYFGLEQAHHFASIENQVLSGVTPVDAIRCNHNYGISSVLIGFEAYVDNKGDRIIEKTRLSSDLCYRLTAFKAMLTNSHDQIQHYHINMDGRDLSGRYYSILVANQPWYGENMCPGIDARPDDGLLDVYVSHVPNRLAAFPAMHDYTRGRYAKHPDIFRHYMGRRLEASSGRLMWLSVDGETFYSNHAVCELLPGAIDFVCPSGVTVCQ